MSLTYGANSTSFFAKAQIIGFKDEDRDHHNLEDIQNDGNKFGDISSFAVFDGHGGKKAANICKEKACTAIGKFYVDSTSKLSEIIDSPFSLHSEDVVDTLFVKAIHEGVAAVHEASIRESETAGTTLCSLFLIPIDHQKQVHDILQSSTAPATAEPWQPPQADVAAAELGLINTTDCGRSYKVMCANVGDSRCVMVGCSAEPVKVSRKGASLSGGTSSNNLAALAVDNRATHPNLSLSRSAKSFASLSNTNLSALGSIWGIQSSKVSESNQQLEAVNNKGSVSMVVPPPPPPSTRIGPNLTITNPFDRLRRSLAAYSRSEDEKDVELDSTLHTAFPVNDDQMEEEPLAAGTTMQVSVRAVTLCEDHKPSSKRERFRVEQRVKIGQQVLPIPVRAFDQSDEDFVQLYYQRHFRLSPSSSDKPLLQSFEGSGKLRRPESFVGKDETAEQFTSGESLRLLSLYRNVSREYDGDSRIATDSDEIWSQFKNQVVVDFDSPIFGSNIKTPFLHRLYEATKLLQQLLGGEDPLKGIHEQHATEEANAVKMIRAESCFRIRLGSDGASGPEAYFPRFSNNSLLMTRSIGDKNGPRGCLPRADITAVTVHATQHARFVLASDGVWDVVDEELIRKVAMYYKYKDPRDLAVYLAEKAVKRRTKQGLSKDDITVFVIDVNPHNAVFIKTAESKDGDHYYPAYHMTAAKKWTPMKSSVLSSTVPTATLSIPITKIDIADYSSSNSRCYQS